MCEKSWTIECDEILINYVKNHELLYNVKHKDYRKTELKGQYWREIATILDTSDFDCMKRWGYVRDYYVRRRSKHVTVVGSRYEIQKKRAELLSFLDGAKVNDSCDDHNENDTSSCDASNSNELLVAVKAESISDDEYYTFTESAEPAKKCKKTANYADFDETDLFFASMGKIVKKLPRSEQVELRMQISALVGQAELRQIANERR